MQMAGEVSRQAGYVNMFLIPTVFLVRIRK